MWGIRLEKISAGKVTISEFLNHQNAWVSEEVRNAGKVDLNALSNLAATASKKKPSGKKRKFFKKK